MTLFKGTIPSGPGDITVYQDESTELFKSHRLVERVLISNRGDYSLPLPKAGTYIVEVRTSTYHYPRFTVTSTSSTATATLPLPVPIRRGAPTPRIDSAELAVQAAVTNAQQATALATSAATQAQEAAALATAPADTAVAALIGDLGTQTGLAYDTLTRKRQSRRSVLEFGAKMDGVSDDSAAFQSAIDAVGSPFVPPGTAFLSQTLYARRDGDGLVGSGSHSTLLICASGFFQADPSLSKRIRGVRLEGFTVNPVESKVVAHDNGLRYADEIAINLTGMGWSRVYDVNSNKWQTHYYLGYSPFKTYKNHIAAVSAVGGDVGVFLGGSASPRDGSNANVFVGVSTMSMKVHYQIRGALNSIVSPRIENPLQSPGYPATSIAFQFDPGFYAISNYVISPYVELVGSGNYGIKVTSDTGVGSVSPNGVIGGSFSFAPVSFEVASYAYGFTLQAAGLPTQLSTVSSDGVGRFTQYAPGGGILELEYTDSVWRQINRQTTAAAPPTSGTWAANAIVWNRAPKVGDPVGWVCTASGTPGTWVAMANL